MLALLFFMSCGQKKRALTDEFVGCPIAITESSHPRPGMEGLYLTCGEPLIYEIDSNFVTTMQALNWGSYCSIPHAKTEFSITIDDSGKVMDIQPNRRVNIDSPAAEKMVKTALKTWRFTPYKSGTMTISFNKSSGILIDTRDLTVNERYRVCKVKTGILQYINNGTNISAEYY